MLPDCASPPLCDNADGVEQSDASGNSQHATTAPLATDGREALPVSNSHNVASLPDLDEEGKKERFERPEPTASELLEDEEVHIEEREALGADERSSGDVCGKAQAEMGEKENDLGESLDTDDVTTKLDLPRKESNIPIMVEEVGVEGRPQTKVECYLQFPPPVLQQTSHLPESSAGEPCGATNKKKAISLDSTTTRRRLDAHGEEC